MMECNEAEESGKTVICTDAATGGNHVGENAGAEGKIGRADDDMWENRERCFYSSPRNFFLLVLLVYFCWAMGVPLTKLGYTAYAIGEGDIPQMLTYAGIRLFFAGLLALGFCGYRGVRLLPASGKEAGQILKLGLIMSVLQYIFLYIGTALSPGVVASILSSSGAFLGMLFSSLVFKEDRMTVRKSLGCALGVVAVIILNVNDLGTGMQVSVIGGLLVIASQGAGTLGGVYLKYISPGKNAIWLGAAQTFTGGGILIFIGLLGGGSLHATDLVQALAPTVAVILTSCLALILSNQLYKYNNISKVVVFSLLLPIFGTVLSALMLGESLASATLLVSLLINCAGVALVTMERSVG